MSMLYKISKNIKSINCIRKQHGAIFVLTALMLPVLLGCMGIAYDVGNLYMHKARLQNVTDAAALAGGGLFKNPPDKTEPTADGEYISAESGKVVKLVNNVEEVVKLIQNVDYKEGTTIRDSKNGNLVITTNSPNHVQADLEAKRYIEHNAVNLGNPITTEELSALAYNDTKTTKVNGTPNTSGNVTTTVNTETTKVTDAKFYRVIASEEVPLYFLPVILGENKRTQTVRTTSVAMLDNTTETTKTTTITETAGGSVVPFGGKTILNNLFTFSDYLYVVNKYDSDDPQGSLTKPNNVKGTFDGDIVYTNPEATLSYREQLAILQNFFPDPDSMLDDNLTKVAYELADHTHYAILNETIDVKSTELINAFKSPFFESDGVTYKSTATPVTWTEGQVTKSSALNQLMKEAQDNNREINVFYDANTADGADHITIDVPFIAPENGDLTKPVYFYINPKSGRQESHITVSCKMVRPLVVVWLGTGGNLGLKSTDGGEFKGVIYAPYRQVDCHTAGYSFEGNIIADKLNIQSTGQSYKVHNYLANENVFKDLTKITSTGSNLTQAQYDTAFSSVLDSLINGSENDRKWNSNRAAINADTFEWIKNNYNTTGEGGITSLNSNPNRTNIIEGWIIAYLKTLEKLAIDYQDFRLSDLNKISKFPWDNNYTPSDGIGDPTPQTQTQTQTHSNLLPSQFRLINPRTETNPYFATGSDI